MRDKRNLPIMIALLLSLVVLWFFLIPNDKAMTCIVIISFILVGLFILFFLVTRFIKTLSIWLTLVATALIIFLGVITITLSRYTEVVKQIPWDIRMVALGFAVVSFGWGLFIQTRPKQQDKFDNLDEEVDRLSIKIQGVNNKLSDLEKTADVFLKQFPIASKGGEQTDKDGLKHELELERASIPPRLAGYLVWQSVLVLAFAEIMKTSVLLCQVLGVSGLISSIVGIVNFWGLPSKVNALEDAVFGQKDRGTRRFIRTAFQGRSQGIYCSLVFAVFWIFGIVWSFCPPN